MPPSQPAATRGADQPADSTIAALERPTAAGANAPGFGSDVVADTLRALDIPYIAVTPGASYRGLHDSIVNYLGNAAPQMLLCVHEESAVAIAHGYAKVTGKAIAAAVHSNVGLQHASMAMFNAWCDRMAVIVLGATGPVDAVKRRPWIDWIHTARDQGALIRGYSKWDDQPSSPGAAGEAILRGTWNPRHQADHRQPEETQGSALESGKHHWNSLQRHENECRKNVSKKERLRPYYSLWFTFPSASATSLLRASRWPSLRIATDILFRGHERSVVIGLISTRESQTTLRNSCYRNVGNSP